MKKIGIVTFQRALNYGALLQMYALHRFVSEHFREFDVTVVDYYSPLCEKESKGLKNKNVVLMLLKKVYYAVKEYNFRSFVNRNIKISKKINIENVAGIANDYDVMIAGSDQIWNPSITDGDMNYLLSFSNSPTKISYAASIGKTELSAEYVDCYKKHLGAFKNISVRELSAKAIVDNLFEKDTAVVNIDPTLLLTSEQWNALANKSTVNNYLFVYQVCYSESLLFKAREFAHNKGLKVVYVGPFTKMKGVCYVPAPSIEKLLSLFKNSEYVFTNSFHGTVFSMQYNKRFFVDLMFSDGRNDRITDLLKMCDLYNRLDLENIDVFPNWGIFNYRMAQERKKALEYFCNSLCEA